MATDMAHSRDLPEQTDCGGKDRSQTRPAQTQIVDQVDEGAVLSGYVSTVPVPSRLQAR
jgi:hypothetical protein